MTDWRFYGHGKEIRILRKLMDEGPAFDAIAVRGRRQVGKSLPVRHFFRNRGNASPVIICHLADSPGPDFSLKAEVMKTETGLLDGFRPTGNDVFDFPHLAGHLLERGCTVVLNEFQRIDFNGTFQGYLPSMFQKVPDDMKHSWDNPRRGARLASQASRHGFAAAEADGHVPQPRRPDVQPDPEGASPETVDFSRDRRNGP